MIQDKIRREIFRGLREVFPSLNLKMEDIELEKAKKSQYDFASNIAFKLAKELKSSPKEITDKLITALNKKNLGFEITAEAGFLNFNLNAQSLTDGLSDILNKKQKYANLDLFKNKKIQVEFISANPTGPLTLGNGRGGFGGDVLANVFKKCGAQVTREYYVNDGGNQVKILAESLLAESKMIPEPEQRYKGEYISEYAKKYSKECKKLQADLLKLGQFASKIILENMIKPAVKKMGITFDVWFSEDKLMKSGAVEEAISKLTKYELTEEKDGAVWMKTTKFGDDKDRVLVKSDGEKTYFANDVAYHFNKLYKRRFAKIVNFWGADHHGYVGRMQAAVAAMSCPDSLDIIIFQLVRLIKDGKEYKMSKRAGTYVTMDDLFELIGNDASDVARFFFLSRDFDTHMDFDLNLARETGEKNPVFYVKYAHARLSGILRNAKVKTPKSKIDLTLLNKKEEQELIKELLKLPEIIKEVATDKKYPIHKFTYYVRDVAGKFHNFYDKCRVIDESNPQLTAARLELVRATKIVLKIVGEDLIGIKMPEKM